MEGIEKAAAGYLVFYAVLAWLLTNLITDVPSAPQIPTAPQSVSGDVPFPFNLLVGAASYLGWAFAWLKYFISMLIYPLTLSAYYTDPIISGMLLLLSIPAMLAIGMYIVKVITSLIP